MSKRQHCICGSVVVKVTYFNDSTGFEKLYLSKCLKCKDRNYIFSKCLEEGSDGERERDVGNIHVIQIEILINLLLNLYLDNIMANHY